jgi:ubiquinone/menaquinone biosynthesis C-methylase UbiE
MHRVDAPEILDSFSCPVHLAQAALTVLGRMNRWFGGVTTTQKMVECAARVTGEKQFSLLEVASGLGEVPALVRRNLAGRGIALDVTLLDRARSHLPRGSNGNTPAAESRRVVSDALALPFPDGAFDLVSCNLFAHHLNSHQLAEFVKEGLRVSRRALLINDIVRHPLHLASLYASYPIMLNRIAWLDGITSVRRAYLPEEIRSVITSASCSAIPMRIKISRHYLFRMGVIVWTTPPAESMIAEETSLVSALPALPGYCRAPERT